MIPLITEFYIPLNFSPEASHFHCSRCCSFTQFETAWKHSRPPCPSLSSGVCSNSRPLNRWCHPTISSFVVPFSCYLQSSPELGSFPELVLHIRWPKYWSFSLSISPSSEYSRLISFRIDWFDLLAVQGTLKSLLQHHSSKTSIIWHSAFFMIYSHIQTWLLQKPQLWLHRSLSAKGCLCFLIRCLGLS